MPQPFLNVFQADTVCIEYFRFMSGSEDVERKNIPEPEFVPSVTYFTHDTGFMSASVARDFHYPLLMPEPERYFTVSLAAQQLGISQQEAETGGDPFLDIELPQMILEHHAEAAPFM